MFYKLLTLCILCAMFSLTGLAQDQSIEAFPTFEPYDNNREDKSINDWEFSIEEAQNLNKFRFKRFFSVDRFAHKYPSLTPYQYAGSNPVLFIDVNGDSIWVNYYDSQRQRQAVYYMDGKFYNSNGSEYTGNNSFVSAVGKALGKLGQKSRGASLVGFLAGHSRHVNIYSAGRNAVNGNTVYFNPNSTTGGLNVDGNVSSKPFIGLGHELAHIEGDIKGKNEPGVWYKESNGDVVHNSEKYATHVENQIRAEHSIPLREYYSYTVTPPSSTRPFPRYTGNPTGRLLIPGTKNISRFHQQTINMGGNPNFPVLFPYRY